MLGRSSGQVLKFDLKGNLISESRIRQTREAQRNPLRLFSSSQIFQNS